MGLISKKNIKDIQANITETSFLLRSGYEDNRLWTGISSKNVKEIPAYELSGRTRKSKIYVGDTIYRRDHNYEPWPIIVVGIRHLDKPSADGVIWVIDWIYKDTSYKLIHSSRAQNLFAEP